MKTTSFALERAAHFLLEQRTEAYTQYAERVAAEKKCAGRQEHRRVASLAGQQAGVMRNLY